MTFTDYIVRNVLCYILILFLRESLKEILLIDKRMDTKIIFLRFFKNHGK